MDAREAILKAGGKGQVARICGVSYNAVVKWFDANRLPSSEWTGDTDYAKRICTQARLLGHDIKPIEVCPMSGPYMHQPMEKAA